MKKRFELLLPTDAKGIYAIAGIGKNSGKTTLTNYLLTLLGDKTAGVLTTGRDGEERDEVFGNPKPPLRLHRNTLFTTTTDVADGLGAAAGILEKLPWQAAGKQLWLVKALRDIETEITGPSNVAAQTAIARLMLEKGAEIVMIDGSMDRKSIALSPEVKGVFLVAGGSFGSKDKILSELAKQVILSGIRAGRLAPGSVSEDRIALRTGKSWQDSGLVSVLGQEQELAALIMEKQATGLYLSGALTDAAFSHFKPLLPNISKIIVKHPLHLHLSKANLEHLTATCKVECLHPYNILGVAVNSWSVSGNHIDSRQLREEIRSRFTELKVIDVREG